MKKKYYILLLILFICGLRASSANGQTATDNNVRDVPPKRLYYYDSTDVKEIAKIILENEMLKQNESIYNEKDSLYNADKTLFEGKISSLQEIIRLKDQQLKKFEKMPVKIEDRSWKWWQYVLAAIGAVTFGFTTGIIYESNLNR